MKRRKFIKGIGAIIVIAGLPMKWLSGEVIDSGDEDNAGQTHTLNWPEMRVDSATEKRWARRMDEINAMW